MTRQKIEWLLPSTPESLLMLDDPVEGLRPKWLAPGQTGDVLQIDALGRLTWGSAPPSQPAWPLLGPDGTLAAPSYSFVGAPSMGMFRAADDQLTLVGGDGARLFLTTEADPSWGLSGIQFWDAHNGYLSSGSWGGTTPSTAMVVVAPTQTEYFQAHMRHGSGIVTVSGSSQLDLLAAMATTPWTEARWNLKPDGTLTLPGPIRALDGTAAVPSYSFASAPGLGARAVPDPTYPWIEWSEPAGGRLSFGAYDGGTELDVTGKLGIAVGLAVWEVAGEESAAVYSASRLELHSALSLSFTLNGARRWELTTAGLSPSSDNLYDLGDATHQIRDLYLANEIVDSLGGRYRMFSEDYAPDVASSVHIYGRGGHEAYLGLYEADGGSGPSGAYVAADGAGVLTFDIYAGSAWWELVSTGEFFPGGAFDLGTLANPIHNLYLSGGIYINGTPAGGGGGSLTWPLLAPDGSFAAPSYSWANDSDTGFAAPSGGPANGIAWVFNGTPRVHFGVALNIGSEGALRFTQSAWATDAADVVLARAAPGVLAQQNGANPQAFRVYGDAATARYLEILGGAVGQGHAIRGFGTNAQFLVSSTGSLMLAGGGSSGQWAVNAAGMFFPLADNGYDIGYGGGGSIRTLYLGTSLNLGGDVILARDGAGYLAQRNGTNPQTFLLYNSFVDVNNVERLYIGWTGNEAKVVTEAGGTGQARALYVGTRGNEHLYLQSQNVARWLIAGSSGGFLPVVNSTYDIGQDALRVRDVYLGNSANLKALAAAPGTPPANSMIVYAKTDKKVYAKDDAGLETALGVGFANPLTTAGDLFIGGASGAPSRLAAVAAGAVLASAGTGAAPTWSGSPSLANLTLTARFVQGQVTITYSASMTPDAALGNDYIISASNATAFTINAPTNPSTGQRITIRIRNTTGSALGAATWNAIFKMAAWTNPATATSRAITFWYNGTNWVEVTRTTVDVPN